jgi:hypothetical protein
MHAALGGTAPAPATDFVMDNLVAAKAVPSPAAPSTVSISRTVLSDLNWVRSSNLRQAIAQMYDMPDGAARLRALRSLDISHAPGFRTTALLLLGWFSTLLGWKGSTVNAAGAITFTAADGAPIPCELSESSGAPIHRVVLEHDDVSITVDHPKRAEYLNLTLVWKDGRLTRHLVPADSTDLADILDEELSRGSRHGIYLRALAAAEALM